MVNVPTSDVYTVTFRYMLVYASEVTESFVLGNQPTGIFLK